MNELSQKGNESIFQMSPITLVFLRSPGLNWKMDLLSYEYLVSIKYSLGRDTTEIHNFIKLKILWRHEKWDFFTRLRRYETSRKREKVNFKISWSLSLIQHQNSLQNSPLWALSCIISSYESFVLWILKWHWIPWISFNMSVHHLNHCSIKRSAKLKLLRPEARDILLRSGYLERGDHTSEFLKFVETTKKNCVDSKSEVMKWTIKRGKKKRHKMPIREEISQKIRWIRGHFWKFIPNARKQVFSSIVHANFPLATKSNAYPCSETRTWEFRKRFEFARIYGSCFEKSCWWLFVRVFEGINCTYPPKFLDKSLLPLLSH